MSTRLDHLASSGVTAEMQSAGSGVCKTKWVKLAAAAYNITSAATTPAFLPVGSAQDSRQQSTKGPAA